MDPSKVTGFTKRDEVATDRIAGVRRKLAQARLHLNVFNELSTRLSQDNTSYGRQEYDYELSQYEFHVRDDWFINDDFAIVAGDLLFNARSALDHLAHALARRATKKTGFPIYKSQSLFDCFAGPQMRNMKASAKRILQDFQPYKGAKGLKSLWWLHELNNIDKHRALLVVALNVAGGVATGGFGSDVILNFPRERLVRDQVFLTVKAPLDGKTYNYLPIGHLVFDEVAVAPHNWPAEAILGQILDDIENKVIPAFGPSDFP